MNPLQQIRSRFAPLLSQLQVDPADYLGLIRPAQDTRFGDYQANFAMPLAGKLKRNSRDVAAEIVSQLDLSGLCDSPEVAGPGFINLRIRDGWLQEQLQAALTDPRIGVESAKELKTYVIDYSSPNVAKPMHVGHIRSTVIGDSLAKIISFLGHQVITDNHLGDWGTQFGMIIYGFKHFGDRAEYQKSPIAHLTGLYRLVRKLVDYRDAVVALPKSEKFLQETESKLTQLKAQPAPADKREAKELAKEIEKTTARLAEQREDIASLRKKIAAVEGDPRLSQLANEHSRIDQAVLEETAKLHAGDAENLKLWQEVLPYCREDMQRIYSRLKIRFDHELGESFYHEMLGPVVNSLKQSGLARESDGAICVFLEGFETPMIVQKRDGAFLYSTSDLATIEYRVKKWDPDVILYVVDHRQHEHFDKLFAAARLWGYKDVDLVHVSFGTVLGDDGKPFKTREGDTVGLESLLDEAESKAQAVLSQLHGEGGEQLPENAAKIAEVIGIGALKYADLSQNRASDYKFSYDKMLELKGNTATYSQYCYARVMGILRNAETTIEALQSQPTPILFAEPIERTLGLALARFGETLEEVTVDYRPNLLASYLFDLTQTFFRFYDQCSVVQAATPELKSSRLQLCALTALTIRTGLGLLGIEVVERM
ncbi:MAG: arginine--tRNA ligase [Planctomycetota bacterium]